MSSSDATAALRDFVSTVNNTGGVTTNEDGEHVPVGDPDWVDLGSAYLRACDALGESPVWETT